MSLNAIVWHPAAETGDDEGMMSFDWQDVPASIIQAVISESLGTGKPIRFGGLQFTAEQLEEIMEQVGNTGRYHRELDLVGNDALRQ